MKRHHVHLHVSRLHRFATTSRKLLGEELIAVLLAVLVFTAPASASTRLEQRSLLMNTTEPGATTSWTVSFRYQTPQPIGSVDMQFCINPIPYMPCVTPPGLDITNATLSEQSGETGYSITTKTNNRIVLSRASEATTPALSSYTFDNIRNPNFAPESFSIRLKTHSSSDATGALVDFGSVKGQINKGIVLQTQVPPMLIFCLAQRVEYGCDGTNDTYYSDMGILSESSTLTAQSEMAVGTNASAGFAITASGVPMSSGTNVINPLNTPSLSQKGVNQFGLNLVANNTPNIGQNPEGEFANAIAAPGYNQPNRFKYTPGDVVAYSPNVSLMKKFTVSYIVNSSPNLKPGVYSTTITFVASGRF